MLGSSVLIGITASIFRKFRTTMNIGNAISRSVTVFREPQRRTTRIKQRERSLHASWPTFGRSFGLGVGLFTKSRNNTLYQRRENLFLGEKLIAWGKMLSLGKIC